MKKTLTSFVTCLSLLAANASTTWTMGDNTFTVDTIFHATTGPGMTTTGLRLSGADATTNVFYSTVDLTNPYLEIRGVKAQDANKKVENVKSMGERSTAKGNGIYLCGTNGDFFDGFGTATVPATNDPCGHCMVDGILYYVGKDSGWDKWATYAVVTGKKDIKIKMGVQASQEAIIVDGKTIHPTTIIGGASLLVENGKVADDKYFSSGIVDHFTSNQARTAVGYNEDRTKMIFLVTDKYTANKSTDEDKKTYAASTGVTVKRVAQIMYNLGCYTAMNCDGGGSSQLYNHKLGIRNIPYGENSYLRPVSNGLFAVSTAPVDNNVAAIEVVQKNVRLASGQSFTPKVYGFNKYGVLVNTNVTGFTFTVAPSLGTTAGTKFTAGSAAGSTHGVVKLGDIKCAVRILTNGGGAYVTSGDDNAPLEMAAPYESEKPMGSDVDPFFLSESWHFVNDQYDDGWDATAPDWTSETAIKSKPCPRFATARNGRFYTVDMTSMSIAEIDKEGNLRPLYKLPALTETYNGTADYYGCAISSDDAGNFLIGHLFTKPETYRVWTVYSPKSGKAKHFAIDCGDEKSSGRIDNIGRVIGDLTKDAYAFVASKATGTLTTQKTLIIHFSGSGDVDGLTATPTFDGGIYMSGTGNTLTTCQPKYASIDEMKGKDPKNSFFWYSKAAGVGRWDATLMTRTDSGADLFYDPQNWGNHSGLNGFDAFKLDGKRFFVMNFADDSEATSNPSGQHIVIKDEKGQTIAEWKNPDFTSTAGYNTITAIPVDENNVNIYIYNCTGNHNGLATGAIAGTKLKVSTAEITADTPDETEPAGIDDIVADENNDDPTEYFNLQGLRIKNPSNGIYIVRQGNKVSKVFVK